MTVRQKSGREMIFAVHAIEDASYYNRYAAWCDVEWFRYRRKSEAMHSLTGMTLGHKSGMYIQFLLRYSHWPCVCVLTSYTNKKIVHSFYPLFFSFCTNFFFFLTPASLGETHIHSHILNCYQSVYVFQVWKIRQWTSSICSNLHSCVWVVRIACKFICRKRCSTVQIKLFFFLHFSLRSFFLSLMRSHDYFFQVLSLCRLISGHFS